MNIDLHITLIDLHIDLHITHIDLNIDICIPLLRSLYYITEYQCTITHIRSYYVDIACDIALHRYRHIEGVPPLESYQHKRRKLVEKQVAGVQLDNFMDLQRWAAEHLLPERPDVSGCR